MSDTTSDDLEALWENLLSRQPDRVRAAFAGLSADERSAVLAHLQRMAEEPGWHPEQRKSAAAALKALEE
jgi:hypothetical protein